MSSGRHPPTPGRIYSLPGKFVVYHPKARPRIVNLTVSHILVKHDESCYPFDALGLPVNRSKWEASKLIKSLHFLISNGVYSFDDLVFSFSDCKSKANKGILEFKHFQPGTALDFFKNAAVVLCPGEISKFSESPNGFQIFYRRSDLEPNASRKRILKKSNSAKYRLCQILVKHRESRMPIDTMDLPVTRSKREAMEIIKSLHYLLNIRCFTFHTLVSMYSDCLSKFNKGIIDTKQFREGIKEEKFNYTLAPGEHSEVIESPNGFHILCYCRVRYARRGGSPLRSRCESSCGYYTQRTFNLSDEPVANPTVTTLTRAPDKPVANPTVTILTRAPDKPIANPTVTNFTRAPGKPVVNSTVTTLTRAPDKPVANPTVTILTRAPDKPIANPRVTNFTRAPGKPVVNSTVTILTRAPDKPVANPTVANLTRAPDKPIVESTGTIPTGALDEPVANPTVTIPTGAPDKPVANPTVTILTCAPDKPVTNPTVTNLTRATNKPVVISTGTIPTGAPDKPVANPTVTILTGANPSVVRTPVSNLKISHILISKTKSAVVLNYLYRSRGTHKQIAKRFITDLRIAINNECLTFAKAAAIYSDCLSSQDGGNIEKKFRPGLMGEAFDKAALALAPGEISEVVESRAGFHIIHRRRE